MRLARLGQEHRLAIVLIVQGSTCIPFVKRHVSLQAESGPFLRIVYLFTLAPHHHVWSRFLDSAMAQQYYQQAMPPVVDHYAHGANTPLHGYGMALSDLFTY